MFSILNRALSWALTSFGNKFCLKKRSRLIKTLDNRFHVKFMQLEINLFFLIIEQRHNVNEWCKMAFFQYLTAIILKNMIYVSGILQGHS